MLYQSFEQAFMMSDGYLCDSGENKGYHIYHSLLGLKDSINTIVECSFRNYLYKLIINCQDKGCYKVLVYVDEFGNWRILKQKLIHNIAFMTYFLEKRMLGLLKLERIEIISLEEYKKKIEDLVSLGFIKKENGKNNSYFCDKTKSLRTHLDIQFIK